MTQVFSGPYAFPITRLNQQHQNTDPDQWCGDLHDSDQWHGLIRSSSTTGLPKEEPLCSSSPTPVPTNCDCFAGKQAYCMKGLMVTAGKEMEITVNLLHTYVDIIFCWRTSVNGAAPLLSGVQWWMRKWWGQWVNFSWLVWVLRVFSNAFTPFVELLQEGHFIHWFFSGTSGGRNRGRNDEPSSPGRQPGWEVHVVVNACACVPQRGSSMMYRSCVERCLMLWNWRGRTPVSRTSSTSCMRARWRTVSSVFRWWTTAGPSFAVFCSVLSPVCAVGSKMGRRNTMAFKIS